MTNIAIGCTFDVAYHGTEIDTFFASGNLRLVMPNGDLRAPLHSPIETVDQSELVRGLQVVFVVPWPAPGKYQLRLLARGRTGGDVLGTADTPLAMPTA